MQAGVCLCVKPAARTVARFLLRAAAVATVSLVALASVQAQSAIVSRGVSPSSRPPTILNPAPKGLPGAYVITPTSSVANPADLGMKAHTNIRLLGPTITDPMEAPPYAGYAYETPASLGCVYLVGTYVGGCNPNTLTKNPTGGSQSIAIVDAYDDPEAPADLAYFSAVFGLPFNPSKFQVVYTGGAQPSIDYTGGWETEESLDIEYAHAMAPNATIYLVEAQSNYYTDLLNAVTEATNIIQCGIFTDTAGACTSVTGKGEVSMSWGGGEFSGETTYDTYFNQTNVVFFASAGDAPGPEFPSVSPYVVAVGGTSIQRSAVTGNLINEIGWQDAGGGPSAYEPEPSFQTAIVPTADGVSRVTPDVSSDANPYTGVWVYDSFPNDYDFESVGWWIIGGTSVASPTWTGIVNAAGSFAASSTAELTKLYSDPASDFRDIRSGSCYYYMYYNAVAGYDVCTGIGSPTYLTGK
jgi:kumamolisin